MTKKQDDQCGMCSGFSAHLHIHGRCHPSAPLRAEIGPGNELTLFCYLPDCNRVVARFQSVSRVLECPNPV